MSVGRIKQEIDEKIGQAVASGAVERFPDDILLWDYDAVRDYVFALAAIDDLIDIDDIILDSKVLSPSQIQSIKSLIDDRINKIEGEHGRT